jgi:plasmid stabilization system protein ParE
MKARISSQAREDMEEIHEFIARGSKFYAKQTLSKFREKFTLIREMPLSGTSRDELCEGLRSYPVGNYIIFYTIGTTEILIERILNSNRDTDSIMSSN